MHPGETNASWIVHGLLDFLTGDTKAARQLRRTFVFKVVPMLNPDGVINGNYRCSLSGNDLNRQWSTPSKEIHPTIWHTKQLIKRIKQRWLVGLVLDIHGHSRKHGVFTYGCLPDRKAMKPMQSLSAVARAALNSAELDIDSADTSEHLRVLDTVSQLQQYTPKFKRNDEGQDGGNGSAACEGGSRGGGSAFGDVDTIDLGPVRPNRQSSMRDVVAWRVKLLPRIISATAPLFSLDNCSFRMQRAKASTMRMVVFTELGVDCCYTIEASLAGKGDLHFGVGDLMDIGRKVCRSLLAATPSMLPSTAPQMQMLLRQGQAWSVVEAFAEPGGVLREGQEQGTGLAAGLSEGNVSAEAKEAKLKTAFSFLEQVESEMQSWTPLYKAENCAGSGAALLSEAGMQEMTAGFVPEPDEASEKVSDSEGGDRPCDAKRSKSSKDKDKSSKNGVSKLKRRKKKDAFATSVSVYVKEGDSITITSDAHAKGGQNTKVVEAKAPKKAAKAKDDNKPVSVLLYSVDDSSPAAVLGCPSPVRKIKSAKTPKSPAPAPAPLEDVLLGTKIATPGSSGKAQGPSRSDEQAHAHLPAWPLGHLDSSPHVGPTAVVPSLPTKTHLLVDSLDDVGPQQQLALGLELCPAPSRWDDAAAGKGKGGGLGQLALAGLLASDKRPSPASPKKKGATLALRGGAGAGTGRGRGDTPVDIRLPNDQRLLAGLSNGGAADSLDILTSTDGGTRGGSGSAVHLTSKHGIGAGKGVPGINRLLAGGGAAPPLQRRSSIADVYRQAVSPIRTRVKGKVGGSGSGGSSSGSGGSSGSGSLSARGVSFTGAGAAVEGVAGVTPGAAPVHLRKRGSEPFILKAGMGRLV